MDDTQKRRIKFNKWVERQVKFHRENFPEKKIKDFEWKKHNLGINRH